MQIVRHDWCWLADLGKPKAVTTDKFALAGGENAGVNQLIQVICRRAKGSKLDADEGSNLQAD
jgi:hypothetical protein